MTDSSTHRSTRAIAQTGVYLLAGFVLVAGFLLAGQALVWSGDGNDAIHPNDEPGFVVELSESGDAEVVVSATFDLEDDELAAFEELQDSDDAREEYRQLFESRMATLAEDMNEATEREVTVSNAELDLQTVDETGVARLAITWNGLAEVSDDQLVLSEPFASGFTTDRPFYVLIPNGFEVASVTPDAEEQDEGTLQWNEGSELDGFELVFSADADDADDDSDEAGADDTDDDTDEVGTDDTDDADDADDDGAGFGVVVALVTLLGVAGGVYAFRV